MGLDPPLVEFPEGFERRFPAFLAETAARVGPVFRRRFADGGELLYLVGPEANRFVLHTHREHFSHELGWTPVIGERMGKGLLNMDGAEWQSHRQMMNPGFSSAYMARYVPVIHEVIEARTRAWLERGVVDLFDEAREITFDAAAAALIGEHAGPEVDRCRELFYGLFHAFDPANESWDAFRQRWGGLLAELHALVLGWIRQRRARPGGDDVLALIVDARDETGQALSDEQVLAHVKILLLAGHETTTYQSAWLLYLLATHQDVLRRVESEIDGADPSFEALRRMEVLGSCVRESGRLRPPVVMVPRGVLDDVELGGWHIPAGSNLRLGLGGSHWMPEIFAEPGRFDPDRLLPPREEDRRVPYALVTFGGGPRICIGINFAQIEMRALAAHVFQRYRLEPVAADPPPVISEITSFLSEGIQVRVRRRA